MISAIKAAIQTRLLTLATPPHVYLTQQDSISDFPAAVIQTEAVSYPITAGGTVAEVTLRITYFAIEAVKEGAFGRLDAVLHPSNTDCVAYALAGDGTLGGAGSIREVRAENIGMRQLPDTMVAGADFVVKVLRS